MINVDRSVPCYSTSLPSLSCSLSLSLSLPFPLSLFLTRFHRFPRSFPFLPSRYPLYPPLSSWTTYVHTSLDVDLVLTMRVHLLDRWTARWKRRKGWPPSCFVWNTDLPCFPSIFHTKCTIHRRAFATSLYSMRPFHVFRKLLRQYQICPSRSSAPWNIHISLQQYHLFYLMIAFGRLLSISSLPITKTQNSEALEWLLSNSSFAYHNMLRKIYNRIKIFLYTCNVASQKHAASSMCDRWKFQKKDTRKSLQKFMCTRE